MCNGAIYQGITMVARTKYKFYFVSPLFGFSAGIMLLQEFAEYILHRQLSTRCRVWCAIAITRRRAIRTDNTSTFPFHFSELTCLGYLRGSSYIQNERNRLQYVLYRLPSGTQQAKARKLTRGKWQYFWPGSTRAR